MNKVYDCAVLEYRPESTVTEDSALGVVGGDVWQITYPDSNNLVLLSPFKANHINLLIAITKAEEPGWGLVQIFHDSSTGFLNFGYAMLRMVKLES